MKRAQLLMGITCLFLFACKKSIHETPGIFIDELRLSLKDSMDQSAYDDLNFTGAILAKNESLHLYYVRIPFHSPNAFVLVQTDARGNILKGRMVDWEGKISKAKFGLGTRPRFDGSIRIHSLKGESILASSIEDGYITGLHSTPSAELLVEPAPQELPEVVVYSIISDGGFSYFPLLSFGGLFLVKAVPPMAAFIIPMEGAAMAAVDLAIMASVIAIPGKKNIPRKKGWLKKN